jgi:hypothetical protein
MTINKNTEGYWVVSDVIGGYLVTRKYLYYTKREAIRMFREETK